MEILTKPFYSIMPSWPKEILVILVVVYWKNNEGEGPKRIK
jgi:hypothetical protein